MVITAACQNQPALKTHLLQSFRTFPSHKWRGAPLSPTACAKAIAVAQALEDETG